VALSALDVPFDRLADLPRGVWLPTLITGTGHARARLAGTQAWLQALLRGQLPDADADFGDAAAVAPLRAVAGELALPRLCLHTPALAEQVLRTLLWHLDRINDHQPRLSREAAIAEVPRIPPPGNSKPKACLTAARPGRTGALQGTAAWPSAVAPRQEVRAARLLAELPALAELIRRLAVPSCRGATGRGGPAPAARPPAPCGRAPCCPTPGEITGIRLSQRIEHAGQRSGGCCATVLSACGARAMRKRACWAGTCRPC
jgi:hypothetical protein